MINAEIKLEEIKRSPHKGIKLFVFLRKFSKLGYKINLKEVKKLENERKINEKKMMKREVSSTKKNNDDRLKSYNQVLLTDISKKIDSMNIFEELNLISKKYLKIIPRKLKNFSSKEFKILENIWRDFERLRLTREYTSFSAYTKNHSSRGRIKELNFFSI